MCGKGAEPNQLRRQLLAHGREPISRGKAAFRARQMGLEIVD